MESLKRNVADKIETLLETFPCVLLIGARQVGKTHLAKTIRPDWGYYDLEKPSDYRLISEDAELFLNQFPQHIIFDEVQRFPELFNILRGVIDKNRQSKGRFIVTGSSSPELLNEVADSLAGRVGIVEIGTLKANEYYELPLSPFYRLFTEKLSTDDLPTQKPPLTQQQIAHIWLKGGYPEPLMSPNQQSYHFWMENYIETYIHRDIARQFPKLDKIKYQRFISMLASLSGTIVNKSDLGRALEFNESTARNYMSVADKTFIWRELLSFESNIIKSTVKMPKGHLRDTGLLHQLSRIHSVEDLLLAPLIGRSFEGFIIEEIIKGLQSLNTTNWVARYYRARSGIEVDLVLEGPFGCLPIEIKHGISTSVKSLSSLQNFIEHHQLAFGIVINQSPIPLWLTDRIFQLPAGYI